MTCSTPRCGAATSTVSEPRNDLSDVVATDTEHEHHRRLDRVILRGSAWTAMGYGGGQLLTFAGVLVLVRLVEPGSFGLVALASPLLITLQFLQESGLGSALVHRRTEVERAAATVALFSPIASIVLYGVSFGLAPIYANIVHAPELTSVVRVLSLLLVVRGIGIVPNALLERDMRFRARAQVDLLGSAAQVVATIALAASGAEVWALVIGQILGESVRSAAYWIATEHRPNPRRASWTLFREMSRYGRFVTGSNMLNVVNTTADNVMVGRLLGPTLLGYYALAFRLASLPNSVIGYVVGRVMFSVYSSLQDDLASIRRVYLQNLQRIAIFALPVSIALVIAAKPIVYGLLGESWSPSVEPLRLLAIYGLVRSFAAPSGELFKGLGRPGLQLTFSVIYAVALIPSLILLVPPLGLRGAPLALMIAQLAASVPTFITGLRLLHVRPREFVAALGPPFAAAGVLAAALLVVVLSAPSESPTVSLGLSVVVGLLAFAAGVALFARPVITAMWVNARFRST
jgi:O-antigen/teichoic acid export membrane protein